jgi:hypothetical protein
MGHSAWKAFIAAVFLLMQASDRFLEAFGIARHRSLNKAQVEIQNGVDLRFGQRSADRLVDADPSQRAMFVNSIDHSHPEKTVTDARSLEETRSRSTSHHNGSRRPAVDGGKWIMSVRPNSTIR